MPQIQNINATSEATERADNLSQVEEALIYEINNRPGNLPPVSHRQQLPDIFMCNGCGKSLMQIGMSYTCNTHGREWGNAELSEEGYEDHECHDSDTSDSEDYEYECNECDTSADTAFRKMKLILGWINSNIRQVEINKIDDVREIRQFGNPSVVDRQEYRRPAKVFDIWTDDEGFPYHVWHKEIFLHLKKAALDENIPLFNWEHPAYAEINQTITEREPEPEPVPPTPEEEEPEEHEAITESHHSRWWRYCQFPEGVVQCDNPKCEHTFIISREEISHSVTCPKCIKEFDPLVEELSTSNNRRLRFSAATFN